MDINKENVDPERASRSILKHDDRTMPLMSTSRLDNSVKLSRRRVSFAPEVTLHKIDFVPQYASRRETIGAVPLSQDEDIQEESHGQEILEDSSDDSDADQDLDDDPHDFTMDFTEQISSAIQEGNKTNDEQDMEFTQSFPKVHIDMTYPRTNDVKSHFSVQTVEEEMELTQSLPKISIQSVIEEPMDLTQSLSDIKSPAFTNEEIMELTRSLSDVTSFAADTEEPMDLTQPVSSIQRLGPSIPSLPPSDQPNSEVYDEIDMEITQSIANIRMQSPEQPAKQIHISRESAVEPQFPEIEVPIPVLDSDSRKRSGEFDHAKPSKLSKVQPIQSTTTIPLADMTNDSFELDPDYVPVSLSEFLKDLGVRFYDDLEIDSSTFKRFSITDSLEDKQVQLADFVVAANKLPLWSLFNFSNTELTKNIIEGKTLYNQLNETIMVNNPRLFKEFYASDINSQLQLKSEFLLIKEFSRLQARKVWYNWRSQLVDNLIAQLEERIEGIKSDISTLDEASKAMQTSLKETNDKAADLRANLSKMRHFKAIMHNCTPDEIETFKKDMVYFKTQSKELAEKIQSERDRLDEVHNTIESNYHRIGQLNKEIKEKQVFLDENKKYEMDEIRLITMKFKLFAKLANMTFKELDKESLYFVFDNTVELKFSYDSSCFSITPLAAKTLTNEWLLHLVIDQSLYKQSNDVYTNFKLFKARYQTIKQIDRDLSAIALKFPILKPSRNSDSTDFAVQYYNFNEGRKINFKFVVDNSQVAHQLRFNISAQIIKNNDQTAKGEDMLSLLRSECRSTTLFGSINACIIDV